MLYFFMCAAIICTTLQPSSASISKNSAPIVKLPKALLTHIIHFNSTKNINHFVTCYEQYEKGINEHLDLINCSVICKEFREATFEFINTVLVSPKEYNLFKQLMHLHYLAQSKFGPSHLKFIPYENFQFKAGGEGKEIWCVDPYRLFRNDIENGGKDHLISKFDPYELFRDRRKDFLQSNKFLVTSSAGFFLHFKLDKCIISTPWCNAPLYTYEEISKLSNEVYDHLLPHCSIKLHIKHILKNPCDNKLLIKDLFSRELTHIGGQPLEKFEINNFEINHIVERGHSINKLVFYTLKNKYEMQRLRRLQRLLAIENAFKDTMLTKDNICSIIADYLS